jgi:hypothetical protein
MATKRNGKAHPASKPDQYLAGITAKSSPLVAAVSRETTVVGTVEAWPIDRLKPYARNSRTHSAEQIAKIARSIEIFGFTNPILATADGTIIAGHGRTLAAKSIGIETVPVIVCAGWSADQVKAYVIADNKLALDAGWDEAMLKIELGDLTQAGFELELTGFGEEDLNQLFGNVAEAVQPKTGQQLTGLTFSVVVRCTDEAHQGELLAQFEEQGLKCEALIS